MMALAPAVLLFLVSFAITVPEMRWALSQPRRLAG